MRERTTSKATAAREDIWGTEYDARRAAEEGRLEDAVRLQIRALDAEEHFLWGCHLSDEKVEEIRGFLIRRWTQPKHEVAVADTRSWWRRLLGRVRHRHYPIRRTWSLPYTKRLSDVHAWHYCACGARKHSWDTYEPGWDVLADLAIIEGRG